MTLISPSGEHYVTVKLAGKAAVPVINIITHTDIVVFDSLEGTVPFDALDRFAEHFCNGRAGYNVRKKCVIVVSRFLTSVGGIFYVLSQIVKENTFLVTLLAQTAE